MYWEVITDSEHEIELHRMFEDNTALHLKIEGTEFDADNEDWILGLYRSLNHGNKKAIQYIELLDYISDVYSPQLDDFLLRLYGVFREAEGRGWMRL